MKKKEKASQFIQRNLDLFQCPVCKDPFEKEEEGTITCHSNHSFDISKKGTIHFLLKNVHSEYGREMLQSRSNLAEVGLWRPVIDAVYESIENKEGTVLDVGCGEGSHLHELAHKGLSGSLVGFDISKEAIQLAAAQYTDAFWCVADLAQSPFQSEQYDTIINVLSPSNYAEFERLLKPGGQVIKVVPNANYLKELRMALYSKDKPYSNEEIVTNFYTHYPNAQQERVAYTISLSKDNMKDLLRMTPLAWQASDEQKEELIENPFEELTVDVTILIADKKEA